MRALEEELGEQLLVRAGRRSTRTAAGQHVLASGAADFAEISDVKAHSSARAERVHGECASPQPTLR